MGVERTLAIIKPDAIAAEKDSKILQLIEANGFEIVQLQEETLTKERAEAFYAEHKGKPFFDALVSFMTR
jgi:nucleoside-diphosphate kinase